jgi:hypothetical protein
LTIAISDPPGHVDKDNGMIDQQKRALKFPEIFCKDIRLFDKLVAKMREGSEQGLTRKQIEPVFGLEVERHYKRDITPTEKHGVTDMGATFVVFDQLRREGRDSVWTYVARNLSRPLALAFGSGWANVVVGNPPWVAFRHMSADLQKRFKELSKAEHVYVGGKLGTQNDLCALFTVRSTGLYLRPGGRIAFVLPLAALTRGQFAKLRTGSFHSARIAWDEAWTMDDTVQPLFPVPSSVAFGRRRATAKAMPETVVAYTGVLPFRDAPEKIADKSLTVNKDAPRPKTAMLEGGSIYRTAFRNGATLYPRMLCLVDRAAVGRLGMNPAAPLVVSRRGNQDKPPRRSLPRGISANVEAGFVMSVLLGESIAPYRLLRAFEAVVPMTSSAGLLDARAAANNGFPGLNSWMKQAEGLWEEHGKANETLVAQWDHYGKLSAQFPIPVLRLVYAKAGLLPAACLIRNSAIIDHKLYWMTPKSADEARYLEAVLNSETARSRVASLQSRGQWGARDFDKVMFTLPIPAFDEQVPLHLALVAAAREAEVAAEAVTLPDPINFQRARKVIRAALTQAGVAQRVDHLVAQLLADS